MSAQLDLIGMFEGLSLEEAKALAGRIRSAVGPELNSNPTRLVEAVEDVYKDFARSRGRG